MKIRNMKKGTKILIVITLLILWIIVGLPILMKIMNTPVPTISITEDPLGLAWGTGREDAAAYMHSQGYEALGGEEIILLNQNQVYTISNYQNVEGLNGVTILTFDEKGGLAGVILDFKSSAANGTCADDLVDTAYISMRKTLNKQFTKMDYDSLEDYEYWSGEQTFFTLIRQRYKSLTLSYAPGNSVEAYAEEMKNSQKKD